MENLDLKFINAKTEFISSNASEKSVENLYDLIYLLKEIEARNFEENFILAQIYDLIGENIYASKIIEKTLTYNKIESEVEKLNKLQEKIDNQDIWKIKRYRDLRDSKTIKESTKLNVEDFNISKDLSNEYCIEISKKIKNIVIINKNLENKHNWGRANNYIAFSQKEPNTSLLLQLIDYIKWIGQLNEELLFFYNNSNFDYKLNNVDKKWYDALNVFSFWIRIDQNDNFETEIILHDYLQNDFGFRLEIKNKTLINIEYDPIL